MPADLALEDLLLMPEPKARRALQGRAAVFLLLAPVDAIAGRGVLRVLRARPIQHREQDGEPPIELVCGYESYCRADTRK